MSNRLHYKAPRHHPTNLLTSSESIEDAVEEFALKLSEAKFHDWTRWLKRDLINHRLRLDSWDELAQRGTVASSFDSRASIVHNSLTTSTYYSACPVILSDVYRTGLFVVDPQRWMEDGIYSISKNKFMVTVDRGNETVEMRTFYSSKQKMCSKFDVWYDFLVIVNKKYDPKSEDPKNWVRTRIVPSLTIPHDASVMLHNYNLAERFTREIAGLIALTGHDFPFHAATDVEEHHKLFKEKGAHDFGATYNLVDMINAASYSHGEGNRMIYGYENLCLDLNSTVFYIGREKGFNDPLLKSVSQISAVADELRATGNDMAIRFAGAIKEMTNYFLSNYIERNILANSNVPLPEVLMKEKAGRPFQTVPVARLGASGDDWLTMPQVTRLFGDTTRQDAESFLTEAQKGFAKRFASKRSEIELS